MNITRVKFIIVCANQRLHHNIQTCLKLIRTHILFLNVIQQMKEREREG